MPSRKSRIAAVHLLCLALCLMSFRPPPVLSQSGDDPAVQSFAAELMAAKTEEERAALLERGKERVTGALVRELNKQGRTLMTQGKFTEALVAYKTGLAAAQRLDDKPGASLVLIGIGNVHYLQGDYAKARDAYERSLKLAEELGSKVDMARAWVSVGRIHYAQGDYARALELYQKTLSVREEAGDKVGISAVLGSIAGVHYAQGSYEQALEYLLRALKLAEELDDKLGVAAVLTNLGSIYQTQGDYARSLEMRERSLKISEELGDKSGIAAALNSIGLTYYGYGNYEQALEYYKKSLQVSTEIGKKPTIAHVLTNMGNVHYVRGDYPRAIEVMNQALKLDEELGNKAGTAAVLNNLGNVYNDQGDYARALESLQRGLKIAEELGYEHVVVSTLTNIAQTHQYLGKHRESLGYTDRAIALLRKNDNADVLWETLTAAGRAHAALDQFEPARESFLEAISIIEKLRGQLAGGERGQQRFFEGKVSPYYEMVDLLVRRRDTAQALVYAERAKGRVLLDVLSNGRVRINKAMTAGELARDQVLTAELKSLNTQLSRLRPDAEESERAALTARLEKARLEYEAFQTGLYAAHPELKVQRGQAATLTLEEAAKLSPDDGTALVEYAVGEGNSYLFVLTKAPGRRGAQPVTLNVYPLNLKAKELAEMSEDFRRRVAERDLTVKTQARRLYDLLLKAAEKQLAGVSKLVIVPDGPLWDLPFQALHRGPRGYLLEDYAVSYAPSLSVLREMRRKRPDALSARGGRRPAPAGKVRVSLPASPAPELFALGNPVPGTGAVAKADPLRGDDELVPLPDAEREVNTLGKLYGRDRSKVLVGAQATEEQVKAEAGKYMLLHFATHAVLDDRNPMYSRIVLSDAGGGAQGEDGLLEAWELMNLDLTAEMAVLSACQTARGRVGAGEGMIGMSWALFVAGCPTAVVSQWKVDSARTTELMLEFHRNLLRRRGDRPAMTKAEALREAALKLLRSRDNHPAYWAGFVLVGNER